MKLRIRPIVLTLGIALATASIGAFSMTTEEQLLDRASQGDLAARIQLAEIYRSNQAEAKAIEQLELAAAAGNVMAMRLLGSHFARQSDPASFKRGVGYYERATVHGDPDARVELGTLLAVRALSPDIDRAERAGYAQRAARNLSRAASEGHREAAWHLGYLHVAGPSVMRNPDVAKDLITKAADAGQPAAAYWVARHHEQIATSGHNLAEGVAATAMMRQKAAGQFIRYLEAAATAGHVGAMRELSGRYRDGEGVNASAEAALFWDAKSREHRGLIHPVSGSPGSTASPDTLPAPAPKPMQMASDTAVVPAPTPMPSSPQRVASDAPSVLSGAERDLLEVRQRLANAEHRITELEAERDAALARVDALAAELGELRRFRSANLNATELNRQGLALYQGGDYQGAERLFRIASESGDYAAVANLGLLHLRGHGVKQSTRKAVQLLKQASDAGNVVASENLAEIYARGIGIDHDPARARAWYERALAQGSATAQRALGDLDRGH